VQHPRGGDLPPVGTEILAEAVGHGWVRTGGATFVSLNGKTEPVGVLEVRDRRLVDPALASQVGMVAGARLEALVIAQRQRELLPLWPLEGDAKGCVGVDRSVVATAMGGT